MPSFTTLPIVALYVGLNGLILFWLAAATSRIRLRTGIWIGDGGSEDLIWVMRGQLNFAEYVPLCLVILLLMAALGMPGSLVHLFGLVLTLGRVAHAAHFTGAYTGLMARQIGAMLTFGVLLLGSLGLVAHALTRLN